MAAANKTRPTDASVEAYLATLDEPVRADAETLIRLMKKVTREPPTLWGSGMIGFGSYHYRYESGREGDWFLCGFAPRKRELSLYAMPGAPDHEKLVKKLGKLRRGKACLYVKRLEQIDLDALEALLRASVKHLKASEKQPSR